MNDLRTRFISSLRTIADKPETNPGLPIPWFGVGVVRCENLPQIRAFAKGFGGTWQKEENENDFHLVQELAPGFHLLLYASHAAVCKRIVVGTKVIPATVLPARPETLVPERIEEVVEWHCPEILTGEVK